MTTETKTKTPRTRNRRKPQTETKPPVVFNPDQTLYIEIAQIKTNSVNPRKSAPDIYGVGYGIWERQEGSDKDAVVKLALSDKPEDKSEYVKIIERYDRDLVEMASSIREVGLLHPVRVRPIDGGYDLVVGCRRVLSTLYLTLKDAQIVEDGKVTGYKPHLPTILAIVTDFNDVKALYAAIYENVCRLAMSPIDEAEAYRQMMEGMGYSIDDVADKVHINKQTIQTRLDLLDLDDKTKDLVHRRELGVVKAREILLGQRDPEAPSSRGKGHKGDNTRQRRQDPDKKAPTWAQWKEIYESREGVHEKVREFIALEILKLKPDQYRTFAQLKRERDKAEPK